MALRDEIKAARKDLMENGTFKEKISYFFEYYTLHTIVVAVAFACIISLIYQQVTKPEIILNGMVLNAITFDGNNDAVKEMNSEFMDYINMDPKNYEFSINSSLVYNMGGQANPQYTDPEVSQAIMVQVAAGKVDFISSPISAILNYGYGEVLVNLEDVLNEEDLVLYEPYFLYVDRTVIAEKEEAYDNDKNADLIPCPDPTKPEQMEDPIPVFINVTDCEIMKKIYKNYSSTLAVGIPVNATNTERISDFLAYLFQ